MDAASKEAHDLSKRNKTSLAHSNECGCFYCLNIYAPESITAYTDSGETAICPICGIDSVVANADCDVTKSFLKEMYETWMAVKEF